MSTLKLPIVAAAVLATVFFAFAQTAGAPRPDSSEASQRPSHCAEDVDSEAGMAHAPAPAADRSDFSVEGMFVDCCSCMPPCPCEVTEVAPGCRGIGVHQISRGTYAEDDLAGVKIAHAKVVGQWVILYIDAKDEQQRAAAEKFGRAAFAAFGPIQEVKAAAIEVSGADGSYSVAVDGGRIMEFETEPLLGGDGKNPVGYTNIKNAVNPTVFQGTCVSATYSDGARRVTVDKGRNAHFNSRLKSSGKL